MEFLGIIKRTTQIIRKNFKHFLCIAILWVIPYAAFHLHLLDLSSFALDSLVGFSYVLYLVSKEPFPSAAALPPYNPNAPLPKLQLPSLYPIIARFLFSIAIHLIFYPLVTFSVCRACLKKNVSLKGSLLGVPRCASDLALTFLCVGFTFLCVGFVVFGFVMIGISVAVIIEPASAMVVFCVLTAMGMVGLQYLAILFSLAYTVAMLEEKRRGWGAMRRSMDLVKGRRWVALGLACVVYAVLQPCSFSVLWRWRGARMVRVSLRALIALFSTAAHVVLYVWCKSQSEEPLHTLIAASAHFGPPESSPTMEVETAAAFLPK